MAYPWSYDPTWCPIHHMYCDWHEPVSEDDWTAFCDSTFTEVDDNGK